MKNNINIIKVEPGNVEYELHHEEATYFVTFNNHGPAFTREIGAGISIEDIITYYHGEDKDWLDFEREEREKMLMNWYNEGGEEYQEEICEKIRKLI